MLRIQCLALVIVHVDAITALTGTRSQQLRHTSSVSSNITRDQQALRRRSLNLVEKRAWPNWLNFKIWPQGDEDGGREKKLMNMIDRFRAKICADMKDKHGKNFDTFAKCHEFMLKVCKPGNDRLMDGDNKEVTSGKGYCTEYFPETEKKAEEELAKQEKAAEACSSHTAEADCVLDGANACGWDESTGKCQACSAHADESECQSGGGCSWDKASGTCKAAVVCPSHATEGDCTKSGCAWNSASGTCKAACASHTTEGKCADSGDCSWDSEAGSCKASGETKRPPEQEKPKTATAPSKPGENEDDESWYYMNHGLDQVSRMGHMDEDMKLPTQGYWGKLVEHEDLETATGDWQKEFGSDSKKMSKFCKKHPDNPWCPHSRSVSSRLQGLHSRSVSSRLTIPLLLICLASFAAYA